MLLRGAVVQKSQTQGKDFFAHTAGVQQEALAFLGSDPLVKQATVYNSYALREIDPK